ncbi:hypothetical protein [Aurantivibrio plasticivorans]
MMKRQLVVAIIVVGLAACSSSKSRSPIVSERFVAHINEQDMKLFEYSLILHPSRLGGDRRDPPSGRTGGPGAGMGGGMGPPGHRGGSVNVSELQRGMRDDPSKIVIERLEKAIAETGFCSHGYFIHEQALPQGAVGGGSAMVKGECKAVYSEYSQ